MHEEIAVDMRALHDVAGRIEAAAELLRAVGLCGPPVGIAAETLVGTAAQWLAHLRQLRQAVAGTGTALHAVADGYAAAHAEASRGWTR